MTLSPLKDRQISILDAVIREYIRTAHPVASKELMRSRRFDISPATIRSEMCELGEMGYLEQPHTSAGRVPTDKGYRSFVDRIFSEAALAAREESVVDEVFAECDEETFSRDLAKAAAELAGAFAAVGAYEDEMLYETGLSEVLAEPEFQDQESVRIFGRLIDLMNDEFRQTFIDDLEEEETKIYIGEENPWQEARGYTMTVSSWRHPAGFRGFLTTAGPRRTNYPRHLALLNYLHRKCAHD